MVRKVMGGVAALLLVIGIMVPAHAALDASSSVPVRLSFGSQTSLSLEVRNIADDSLTDTLTFNYTGVETYVLTSPGFPSTSGSNGENNSKNNVAYKANTRDAANNIFGYCLQKNLRAAAQAEDRGLRHARFVVLKDAPCVAALVECGFLSNSTDERRLMTDEHRNAIATGIVKGIIEYGHAVRRANPAPVPAPAKTNGL